MKTFAMTIGVACATLSGTALAAQMVYDIDGLARHTDYADGPLEAAATHNDNARDAQVYLYRRHARSSCSSAAFYAADDGTYLASARLVTIAPAVDIAQGRFPDTALEVDKVLQVSCTDEAGQAYLVQHKIASVPKIDWLAEVVPAGEFVQVNQGYSYHSAIEYDGSLSVDNRTRQGHCQVTQDRGVALGLFNGQSGKSHFHADVFVTHKVVANNQPVLLQSVECTNPAGTTKLLKVWDLTNEQRIDLIEDIKIIR
ncbi:hypothetical protein GCM10009092_12110 [Bowmanella denitrificans]|uniref:Uncharacterized protein n=1 Tax=Bowmanella denitrificans TaxID=366582 RepID=A0ABP3GQP8_9ALTE|nr:hypothetical protein [Bowmanella denitrificans]